MNVSIIGTGYVGLTTGACLAFLGHKVTCVDADENKIKLLEAGRVPFYEPHMEDLLADVRANLCFTMDYAEAVPKADVVFIAVGTPPDEDGSADLRHVLAVAELVGKHMTREVVVVTKSTVPVGTADKVEAAVAKTAKLPFHLCSNPEFLKEGAAVDDFLKPDRVVLGVATDHARSVMAELYAPFVRTGKPIIFMDIPSAEMTKYAANAMLATRISFMNEVANLCERVGADVDMVRKGIGSDDRIGPSFLFPGPGYGGSCFPKDVKALLRTSVEKGAEMSVLHAVEEANDRQKHLLFAKLKSVMGASLKGSRIAVWGLAFKPQTDDMRESPALTLIDELIDAGATAVTHDPVAMPEAKRRLGDRVTYAATNYDALTGAAALVVVTDWNEYRHPDFSRIKSALSKPIVIDGRNLYDPAKMKNLGFTYRSIGRGDQS